MAAEHAANPGGPKAEYNYYPEVLPELYRRRKYQWGIDFYGFLGIRQDDEAARLRQTGRNFLFFDSPVGLIFTLNRSLGTGSVLYPGLSIHNGVIEHQS